MVNALSNLVRSKSQSQLEARTPAANRGHLRTAPAEIAKECLLVDIDFVIFDLETTGFKPHQDDRVISLGAVKMRGCSVDESNSYYELFNPERNIPSIITRLTGIDYQMVSDEPTLLEQLPDFFEWVGDSLLAAHIASFDLSFINQTLTESGYLPLAHQIIDTRQVIIRLYPQLTNCSLEEICTQLGISAHGRHNALGDAIIAGRILEIALKELKKRRVRTFGDLELFLA